MVVEVPPRALWSPRTLLRLNQERLEGVAKERKRSSFSCECAHTVISFIKSEFDMSGIAPNIVSLD